MATPTTDPAPALAQVPAEVRSAWKRAQRWASLVEPAQAIASARAQIPRSWVVQAMEARDTVVEPIGPVWMRSNAGCEWPAWAFMVTRAGRLGKPGKMGRVVVYLNSRGAVAAMVSVQAPRT